MMINNESDNGEPTNDVSEYMKLFIGQIPRDYDEATLKDFFEEFGPVHEVTIMRDPITHISKGCAFITYVSNISAMNAIINLHDKVRLENSPSNLQVRVAENPSEKENKLFVGMLPRSVDENMLYQLFIAYGELREVHVIKLPDGTSRGCAFVKYVQRHAALAAIEGLNEVIPPGASRPMVVKFADPKKPQVKATDYWNPAMQMGAANSFPIYPNQQLMNYLPYTGTVNAPRASMRMPNSVPYYPPQYPVISGEYPIGTDELSMSMAMPFDAIPQQVNDFSQLDLLQANNTTLSGDHINGTLSDCSGSDLSQSNSDREAPSIMTLQMNNLDSSRPPEGPSGANLFIYHLPRDLTDADLATLFAPFGNVISAKVFVDKKTSDSKGFGFVSYDELESADAAIMMMHGFQIGSKRLKVQHKKVFEEENVETIDYSNMGLYYDNGPMEGGPYDMSYTGNYIHAPIGSRGVSNRMMHHQGMLAQPTMDYSLNAAPMSDYYMHTVPTMEQHETYDERYEGGETYY